MRQYEMSAWDIAVLAVAVVGVFILGLFIGMEIGLERQFKASEGIEYTVTINPQP